MKKAYNLYKSEVFVSQSKKKLRFINQFGGFCYLCGYSQYPSVLRFYQRYGKGLGQDWSRSDKFLVPKLADSILLCPNCCAAAKTGLIDIVDLVEANLKLVEILRGKPVKEVFPKRK